jgi:membrane-bound lytic murein transglycosylase B
MRHFICLTLIAACLSFPCAAQDVALNSKPFGLWLLELRQDAMKQGLTQATLDDALGSTAPIGRIIELDRKQPESVLTLAQYLANVVNDKRVTQGRQLLDENRELLEAIGKKYGVQPRFIVALWGIETNYGANMGGFRTIDALATLAYDGRRSDFFRSELIKALTILQQEHMLAADMKGSWAGAMGQCQFMPESFLKFAVDYDGDGKRDIWGSRADVFASIANYLSSSGWKGDEGWGRQVQPVDGIDPAHATLDVVKPVSEWDALGVRNLSGGHLPAGAVDASLIYVGDKEPAGPYLVYQNYKVLLKWNRSRFFATAVGSLADKIGQ